jgi:hypothetical protein
VLHVCHLGRAGVENRDNTSETTADLRLTRMVNERSDAGVRHVGRSFAPVGRQRDFESRPEIVFCCSASGGVNGREVEGGSRVQAGSSSAEHFRWESRERRRRAIEW